MNYRAGFLGVLLSLAAFLTSCGGDGGVDFDRRRPTVTATTPAAGATGLAVNATVSATFSEVVASSSVTTSTFTVTPTGGTPIAGTVSASGTTATFTPAAPLAFGTTYTARLTTGVIDLAGNGLAREYTWTFTTVANSAPTILATAPADGASNVGPNATITVTFSEPVDASSVTAATFQVSPLQGANIAGTIVVNGAQATFTPAAPLLPDTTYNVLLTTGITDVDGAPLANPYAWSFRTGANAAPTANAGPDQDVNSAKAARAPAASPAMSTRSLDPR
jgi:hypothetical protein